MSLFPLADCARLLGVHPKTLRQWLKQDPLELSVHPRDARIKCLTAQQVEQLAAAHDRSLQLRPEQAIMQHEAPPNEELKAAPPLSLEDVSLSQKLAVLETRIAQLSEQVAHLTLALLQERERTVERRLSDLETVVQELAGVPNLSPSVSAAPSELRGVSSVVTSASTRPLIEVERRARSRMPPLIEYSAQSSYVVESIARW